MSLTEQEARFSTPLSYRERESAAEVFDQYPGLDHVAAWVGLKDRAYETSRPFRSYDCAHAVASVLARRG